MKIMRGVGRFIKRCMLLAVLTGVSLGLASLAPVPAMASDGEGVAPEDMSALGVGVGVLVLVVALTVFFAHKSKRATRRRKDAQDKYAGYQPHETTSDI